jgi:hypothetical protein
VRKTKQEKKEENRHLNDLHLKIYFNRLNWSSIRSVEIERLKSFKVHCMHP